MADSTARTGVWLIGARGGLATTLVVGARAIARGKASTTGVVTERPEFAPLALVPIASLVFGGHEVRRPTLVDSAFEIARANGTLPLDLIRDLEPDLVDVDREIRPGTALHCGETVESLVDGETMPRAATPRQLALRIADDIRSFRERHRLERVVVVNLASTEPLRELAPLHRDRATLEAALDRAASAHLTASTLYAYAALHAGCAFVNFTPNAAALCPAICALGDERRLPYMGSDGKTGETLVKSALAPMFKYRNLRVLAWQGYNILGDRDGSVLNDERNKASKVQTKDHVLTRILGYPLHTHVGIDYVPSLHDMKTAWDFVHFQGFLDVKMSLQFTWQGCDSILAAPVVLDLVRLSDLALRRAEWGPMRQLSCYFKKPHGVDEHDLHFQFHALLDYLDAAVKATPRRSAPAGTNRKHDPPRRNDATSRAGKKAPAATKGKRSRR
ncbi:MAG: inositol-3-phosphate synthase [Planctomycetes bacterium]|nr:inositol-3-phosphate synthase [Planctomycetota bacterium]